MSITSEITKSLPKSKVTFPCLRTGKTSGNIYFFNSEQSAGYNLSSLNGSSTAFKTTDPFIGSITLEST